MARRNLLKRCVSLFLALILVCGCVPGAILCAKAEEDWTMAYTRAVQRAEETSWAFEAEENYGVLMDLDWDGFRELVLIYTLGDKEEPWITKCSYSIYDFENGKLITVAEDVVTDAYSPFVGAGTEGKVGIALYDEEPTLFVYSGGGETSSSGDAYPIQECEVTLYSLMDLKKVRSLKVYTTETEIHYELNGKSVDEETFLSEMVRYAYLEYAPYNKWIGFAYTYDAMSFAELQAYLADLEEEVPATDPAVDHCDVTKRLVQVNDYWDDDMDSAYLHYNEQTGLLERVSFTYDAPDLIFEYDNSNRLLKMEAGNIEEDFYSYVYMEFFYGEDGRLTKWKDFSYGYGNWEGDCFYDDRGRLIQTSGEWDAGFSQVAEYRYDNNGLLFEKVRYIDWKDAESTKDEEVVEYQLDEQERILRATTQYGYGSNTESYQYDYPRVTVVHQDDYVNVYYNPGFLDSFPRELAMDFAASLCGRFGFYCQDFGGITVDEDGYISTIQGAINNGSNIKKGEFIWEEVPEEPSTEKVPSEEEIPATEPDNPADKVPPTEESGIKVHPDDNNANSHTSIEANKNVIYQQNINQDTTILVKNIHIENHQHIETRDVAAVSCVLLAVAILILMFSTQKSSSAILIVAFVCVIGAIALPVCYYTVHTWKPATCTVGETCKICGKEKGEPLGHAWKEASCEEPGGCARCGRKGMSAHGHVWTSGNGFVQCSVCGLSQGQSLPTESEPLPTEAETIPPETEVLPPETAATRTDNAYAAYNVGDRLCFGEYEQDANLKNGDEPIWWRVLDKEEDRILVISEYAIECMPFHPANVYVDWENCDLREWLNEDFYETAFDGEERSLIVLTSVPAEFNPKNYIDPGADTLDYIYIPSISEVDRYFIGDEDRQCEATPYAVSKGAYAPVEKGYRTWWQLRNPGEAGDKVANVNSDGKIDYVGSRVESDRGTVRVMMWLRTEE